MNNFNNTIVAIVPAAGSGQRMQSTMPKQYIKIGHATILEHTLQKLLSIPQISQIIVAISSDDDYFLTLAIASHPKIKTTIGGDTRAASVLAGLQLADEGCWALVHDAARPCVCVSDIETLIKTVFDYQQGAILATKITDTIKKSISSSDCTPVQIEKTCDRRFLWAAATPQMFNVKDLKACLISAQQNQVELTDEASAIEYGGKTPLLVECKRDNIKVTRLEDLPLATLYLQEQGYIHK